MGRDARGNLTSSGSDSYTYSSENLMTSGTVGGVTTPLTYDPLLRLYQIGTSGGMKLVYDGANIIGQSNGTTLGRRYVAVPGSDEMLVEYKVSSGTKDYKLTDERGSVIASTDASGNGSAINTYDEYGIPGAGNTMRFQYTGQFFLSELGLQYSKGRIYSPTLGRFMQTDPIGYGDGMNQYNYVKGNPVNGIDPSGLNHYYYWWNGTRLLQEEYNDDDDFIGESDVTPSSSFGRIQGTGDGAGNGGNGGSGASGGGSGPFSRIDILPYVPVDPTTAYGPKYCHSLLYASGEVVDEVGGYVNDAGTAGVTFGASVFATSWFTGVGAEAGVTIMGASGTVYAGGTAISTVGTGIKWIAGQGDMVTASRLLSVPTMSLKPVGQVIVDKVQSNYLGASGPCL